MQLQLDSVRGTVLVLMLMRFIWSCQVLLCQQCFRSSVRCEGSLGTCQFRSKRTSNSLRCWYSWSGCCSWWSRWYCVCRFSRWTWTFYCTISTIRTSRADPFRLHPMSNTIPYYILFLALFWLCHVKPCPQHKRIKSLFRTHSCMILTNTTLMKGKVMIRGWNMYEKLDGLTYSHLWCGN